MLNPATSVSTFGGFRTSAYAPAATQKIIDKIIISTGARIVSLMNVDGRHAHTSFAIMSRTSVDNIRSSLFASSRGSSVDDVCFSSTGTLASSRSRITSPASSAVSSASLDAASPSAAAVFVISCAGDGVRWSFAESALSALNGGAEGAGASSGASAASRAARLTRRDSARTRLDIARGGVAPLSVAVVRLAPRTTSPSARRGCATRAVDEARDALWWFRKY